MDRFCTFLGAERTHVETRQFDIVRGDDGVRGSVELAFGRRGLDPSLVGDDPEQRNHLFDLPLPLQEQQRRGKVGSCLSIPRHGLPCGVEGASGVSGPLALGDAQRVAFVLLLRIRETQQFVADEAGVLAFVGIGHDRPPA